MDISFITINYNGYGDTKQLVDSLLRFNMGFDFEIIIVDNASSNNEAQILSELCPEATIVRSETNLGFAGGNNLGIKHAKGKYIMLINNDTYIKGNDIKPLFEFLKSTDEMAIVSPKIVYAQDETTVQYAGFTNLSSITIRNRGIGSGYNKDDKALNRNYQTFYAHGAAMLFQKELIDKTESMCEDYFLYYEEMDWCERIRQRGFHIWYYSGCTIYHKESKTTGVLSPLKVYYMTRNRLYFIHRNRRGIIKLLSIIYNLVVVLLRNIPSYLFSKRFDLFNASIKGVKDFFKMI